MPKAAKYWKEDRFYGFQFLNGCNPESIKRCTELPENFPVTEELVGDLLDKGDTLREAMEVTFPVFFSLKRILFFGLSLACSFVVKACLLKRYG